jgi:recombination protein RecT
VDDLLGGGDGGGKQLVRQTPKELVVSRLPKMLEALPKDAIQRFKQAALAVVMNPNVADCTPESVASAVYACARLNLIPDPVLKQAYIIPFKKKATVVLGYPGLIDLARRACPGLEVNTGVVYDNDDYTLTGGKNPDLLIRKYHWQKGEEPGEVAFSFGTFKSPEASDYTLVVVPRYKLDAIAAAKGGNGSPWLTNFPEMAEKTAIRRMSRLWTLSPERREDARRFREALAIDEADELPAMEVENPDLAELSEGEARVGQAASSGEGESGPAKRVKSRPVAG